ncbi:hypothetical protein BC827DRAFT_1321582 [Russula dissimulans]|nr:hypothetical protein BC827DRAFT_1321582 [Russula dissimulans]
MSPMCFDHVRSKFTTKSTQLTPGHVLCHHVVVTPSRILLEGPFPKQSNRVIRHYQNHAERFIHVSFAMKITLAIAGMAISMEAGSFNSVSGDICIVISNLVGVLSSFWRTLRVLSASTLLGLLRHSMIPWRDT